jgi:amphi-Trp domain-containing protein
LHQLADKLAENQVILRQGVEEIVVDVPDNVVLELKVEEEDKKGNVKRTLEVEIEWLDGDESGGVVTLG